MIEVRHLCKSYDGNAVIDDLSFSVREGERVALIAPSGCGKTTLLRLLSGLEKPDGGQISVGGQISYLFQEPRLFPGFSALDNVAAVQRGADARQNARALLRSVGMEGQEDKFPGELSGGMAQRVVLARALLPDRPVLLMDEPFKGLDEAAKEELYALVNEKTAGRTLLLVTHDEREAARLCTRVLRFTAGMKPVDSSQL